MTFKLIKTVIKCIYEHINEILNKFTLKLLFTAVAFKEITFVSMKTAISCAVKQCTPLLADVSEEHACSIFRLNFLAGYIFDLIFNPETVDSMFFRNVSELLQDFMTLNTRKWNSC